MKNDKKQSRIRFDEQEVIDIKKLAKKEGIKLSSRQEIVDYLIAKKLGKI